jgi:hypothetical protein
MWLAGAGCAGLGLGLAQGVNDASLDALRHRAEARGYRVREVRWDAVLRQRWAVLEDVAHPERPYLMELTESSVAQVAEESRRAAEALSRGTIAGVAPMVIHVGDRVTVWRADANVRMQMAAVADGNAAVGERITLRVQGAGVYGQAGFQVTGVVRGVGSVEME